LAIRADTFGLNHSLPILNPVSFAALPSMPSVDFECASATDGQFPQIKNAGV
jgi:hypothetical protein